MSDIYGGHFAILRSIDFLLMVAVLAHIDLKIPNNILSLLFVFFLRKNVVNI